ncbi:MAG TPA: hypothetical protein VIG24_12840 [Acidimicrobiia bacterium]
MPVPGSKKVRGEGHWWAAINGQAMTRLGKFLEPKDALDRARLYIVETFQLTPGEERNVAELAKELGVPRRFIEEIPDMDGREGYHLHVGDGIGGRAFARPKRDWTLFREA